MTNQNAELAKIYQEINGRIDGSIVGMTTGFNRLDYFTGKLHPGNLVVLGGYTGTGKSMFLLNMINNIMENEKGKRIAIFSTELTREAYIFRYMCMRAGIWKLTFDREPQKHAARMQMAFEEYKEYITTNPNTMDIFGGITNYDEIKTAVLANSYDLIFVDYLQELSVGSIHVTKDAMDLLGKNFKGMALDRKMAVVLVSQVNNYSMSKENDPSKTQLHPFAFGKEISNASHISLVLQRDKQDSSFSPILQCHILKARDGETGVVPLLINDGYRLEEVDKDTAKQMHEVWKTELLKPTQ